MDGKMLLVFVRSGAETLGALIVCLRRARAWGLMSDALHTHDSASPIWTKIYCALSSPEEQVLRSSLLLPCLCPPDRSLVVTVFVRFLHK